MTYGTARGSRGIGARVAAMAMAMAMAMAASAHPLEDAPAPSPAPKELFRGRELIDFTDPVKIEGQVIGPDGRLVAGTPRIVFKPIIRLRADWNDEMAASIDRMK